MRSVVGRVVVLETGVGVPSLTVTVTSVPTNAGANVAASTAHSETLRRVGSVLTDEDGRFSLAYGGATADADTVWNLRLEVHADGDIGAKGTLYADTNARAASGDTESYLVRVSSEKLTAAGIELPQSRDEAPMVRTAKQQAFRTALTLNAEKVTADAGAARLSLVRAKAATLKPAFVQGLLARSGGAATTDTGTVKERSLAATKRGLAQRVRPSSVRARLSLTAAQRAAIHAVAQPDGSVAGAAIEPFFASPSTGEPVYQNPYLAICRDQTLPANKCAGAGTGGDDSPTSSGNGSPVPTRNIPDIVWSVLDAPGAGTSSGRTTLKDLANEVRAIELASGPADATAFYDFQTIQIAFDHVWHDAFDEDVLETALDLHREVTRVGGAPDPAPGTNPIETLRSEARIALRELGGLAGGLFSSGLSGARYNEVIPTRPIQGPLETELGSLLSELEGRLLEPYRFTTYAADETGTSVNFGLVVTYRQTWEPLGYQAGKLVRTLTLAPGEERTYVKKRSESVKKKSSAKDVFKDSLKTDDTSTTRTADAIVEAAQSQTGFSLSYTGTVGASFTVNAAKSSSDTRQQFREAVQKVARDHESERSTEVSTETSFETSAEETGKITNPNDELAVTYLFYELQRRFRVKERIQKITPVVLVAQHVPSPHEITLAWLIQNDWILKRVLLDPSFAPALEGLSRSLTGDKLTVDHLKRDVTDQRALVKKVQENLAGLRNQVAQRYASLERSVQDREAVLEGQSRESFLHKIGDLFTGSDEETQDAARLREDMARDAFDRADRAERALADQLERELSVLQEMSQKYVEAEATFQNRLVELSRLRLHVKSNILYYMQAIWDHEPPDQRFFRLHQIQVPKLDGTLNYRLIDDPSALPMPPSWQPPQTVQVTATIADPTAEAPLVEIADLDRPLGYKGNYMIFPLTSPNVLTRYMSVPYADTVSGVRDPDDLGNYTLSELDDYVCCLKNNLPDADLQALLPGINQAYQALLASAHPLEDTVIVPSSSLFIAALPTDRPILEDFKLLHRAADVEKVLAEVRQGELENVRRAARILANDLADPDIEKTTLVQGVSTVAVTDS